MILNDAQIIDRCEREGMISPFHRDQVRVRQLDGQKVLSYGTSSFGYDARLAPDYEVFKSPSRMSRLLRWLSFQPPLIVDPKHFDPAVMEKQHGPYCDIPPHSFMLGRTVEWFRIPRDILALCYGKSTYARCGLYINVTPLEPEWEGEVTLEIANTTGMPARVYGGEGACQFLQGLDCVTSYAMRSGKYQHQLGITHPTV